MGITLVPHIPDNLVPGRGKHPVKRNCQLHHPQIGGKMPPLPADYGNNPLSYFLGQLGENIR